MGHTTTKHFSMGKTVEYKTIQFNKICFTHPTLLFFADPSELLLDRLLHRPVDPSEVLLVPLASVTSIEICAEFTSEIIKQNTFNICIDM